MLLVQAPELPGDILLVEHTQGHLLTLTLGCARILLLWEDPGDSSSPALLLHTQVFFQSVSSKAVTARAGFQHSTEVTPLRALGGL